MLPNGVILHASQAAIVLVFPVPGGPSIIDMRDSSSSEVRLVQLFQALGIP